MNKFLTVYFDAVAVISTSKSQSNRMSSLYIACCQQEHKLSPIPSERNVGWEQKV